MAESFKPETPEQVREAVAWAAAEETPLEVLCYGSKRTLGRPSNAETVLELSAMRGITLYEPEELVLTAGPGTPLSEIETALAEARQELAFEPPDYGPLLGGDAGAGSVGGMLACNLAGSRRVKAGAARDHFLGFQAVSGRGEIFKSGGRVVKNVTGYDLSKLLCGSWGTLGVLTEITVKVLPKAEKAWTAMVYGLDWASAGAAMTRALQSPYEVSGAAYLPRDLARKSGAALVSGGGGSVTAVRVEGPAPSVEYRLAALRRMLGEFGETEELHSKNTATLWRELRDATPFASPGDSRCVWKLSVPPKDGPTVTAAILEATSGEAFLDWGGGLVWLAIDAPGEGRLPGDAMHGTVRRAIAGTGGHATLIRAPEPVRAAAPVFHPLSPGIGRLSRRVKENFDPNRVLNPGRLYADM